MTLAESEYTAAVSEWKLQSKSHLRAYVSLSRTLLCLPTGHICDQSYIDRAHRNAASELWPVNADERWPSRENLRSTVSVMHGATLLLAIQGNLDYANLGNESPLVERNSYRNAVLNNEIFLRSFFRDYSVSGQSGRYLMHESIRFNFQAIMFSKLGATAIPLALALA